MKKDYANEGVIYALYWPDWEGAYLWKIGKTDRTLHDRLKDYNGPPPHVVTSVRVRDTEMEEQRLRDWIAEKLAVVEGVKIAEGKREYIRVLESLQTIFHGVIFGYFACIYEREKDIQLEEMPTQSDFMDLIETGSQETETEESKDNAD